MTRGRIGLLLLAVVTVVVVVFGLTRSDDDVDSFGSQDEPADGRTFEPTGDPYLKESDDTIEVPDDGDCNDAAEGRSLACESFQVDDTEMAWLVEQKDDDPPIVSFLRRESPTEYRRLRVANGAGPALFDRVNVRVSDLTGDGRVEVIFAFHLDDLTGVDVIEAGGEVVDHFDLDDGQVRVGGENLTTWMREDDGWRREEVSYRSGSKEILSSDHVAGPAEGNL